MGCHHTPDSILTPSSASEELADSEEAENLEFRGLTAGNFLAQQSILLIIQSSNNVIRLNNEWNLQVVTNGPQGHKATVSVSYFICKTKLKAVDFMHTGLLCLF